MTSFQNYQLLLRLRWRTEEVVALSVSRGSETRGFVTSRSTEILGYADLQGQHDWEKTASELREVPR
jgi:hypothetical protein